MLRDCTIAIAGLGLIGGSLARDLAAAGLRVLGADRDPDTLRAALAAGVVQDTFSLDGAGLDQADVLVLALPVPTACQCLATLAPRLQRMQLITDVGSTKRSIVSAAARVGLAAHFVGAHPLAGSHRSGWAASRSGLFLQAPTYLCTGPDVDPAAVALARALWQAVGARARLISTEEHDRLLAWISHLPQAAAFAFGNTLATAGIPFEQLGPGGRDTLRLVGSPPELWTDVALDNADNLVPALARLRESLTALEQALMNRDHDAVASCFATAREWHRDGSAAH